MKIYLYLSKKIMSFSLPKEVSGSFSFDENPEEEIKLINVEARNKAWVLYSTDDISVIHDNNIVSETVLQPNSFYVVRRNSKNYLMYVTEFFDKNFYSYIYHQDINLIIGNTDECTIKYNCEFLNGLIVKVHAINGQLLLEKNNNTNIYINNKSLLTQAYYIKNGDQIDIYGLRLIFLPNIVLINNVENKIQVLEAASKIQTTFLSAGRPPIDVEIKDIDLYTKDEYFSKSPRIRRIIETKVIKLSPPPKPEGNQEMPLLLTIGPMLTMGIMSLVMLVNTLDKIYLKETTIEQAWPQLATSGLMLVSMLVWPLVTKMYNKRMKQKRREEIVKKYGIYLQEKKQELSSEQKLQKEILIENLIAVDQCLTIIQNKSNGFWDKRIDQNDFLVVRIGKGNELLDATVEYPEEGFSIDEDDLRKQADAMVAEFKYIDNVPIGYSLYDNKVTAIMGNTIKCQYFVNNLILQLLTFYSYEDLKLVIFTDENKAESWNYIKYLNHNLSNDKKTRYFSSTIETSKYLAKVMDVEVNNRIALASESKGNLFRPHYLIIIDDYDRVKRCDFVKLLTEIDANLSFSILILENRLSNLPSKCNNFISIGDTKSGVLKNSYENQEQVVFYDEINYTINMMSIAQRIANIPVELENGIKSLPDAITFLEMEKVGKVEQLNILNRWNSNDSTASLKAEIGVDEAGDLLYLDLHEKYHGPHGLIAGMTGSGKSEFIITYILSMAINYSPDDVAFILIDYKGGGLAGAFENKVTGVYLPHLAGTITNLDKAEMDRTLVSIDSEVKRRQQIFNEARDQLGESTVDIYKYQKFYKEGKLKEPVPHLFIVCDEFAELKSQQPDFMDNLISVARIGRSLGVHLILATQKPSGVVNDQIWSNSKFRVCLKVQTESDSKEMLKRPEAASLKQTGRFYLQVGYDEFFVLGQSGWCGAKYFPSDKIIKQVDKSVNFIDDSGVFIKSIQAGNAMKIEAQGEQLAAIMNAIISVASNINKKSKRLWLENINPIILVDNLIGKYKVQPTPYQVKAILGEYDAPEKQEQGLLEMSFLDNGNTLIYGTDSAEREMLLNSIIYSSICNHKAEELNYYIFDYGSEVLRRFNNAPQIGGMVFTGEDEKFRNLFKLINEELASRKKKLIKYGGEYTAYNNTASEKMPLMIIIINNYDALLEMKPNISEKISSLTRDCVRYGIIFIISCNGLASIGRRISQNFPNIYALHLTDTSDFYNVFNIRNRLIPRDTFGRGLVNNDGIHEFQTASLVDENTNATNYLTKKITELCRINTTKAKPIPELPEKITFNMVKDNISTLENIPIGISREELEIVKYDFTIYPATIITSNRLQNINNFMSSLITIFSQLRNTKIVFIDTMKLMPSIKEKTHNYYDSNFGEIFPKLTEYVESQNKVSDQINIFILYGIEKLKTYLDNITKAEDLFKAIKKGESCRIIICDGTKNLKNLDFDNWYSSMKNSSDGIWIGRGFSDQTTLRPNKITKDMSAEYKNDYAYCLKESFAELVKIIDFKNAEEEGKTDE